MTLTTRADFRLSMFHTGPARDFGGTPLISIDYLRSIALPHGTGEGQCDVYWSSHRNLDSLVVETIDLTALTGHLGNPLTFARLVGMIVISVGPRKAGDYGYAAVVITRPVNGVPIFNAVGDEIAVLGRGMFAWFAPRGSPPGVPVTPGTGDLIQFMGGFSQATFDVHLFGTST